ncbi:MAG: response regulator transcription factor [Chloroflexi bacterium]|nr:response regulator transcription factor [Chloroflexota bacterium]
MLQKISPLGTKVLFVSDEPEGGQFWAYALSQKGLDVTLARSIEEAVDRWEDEAFDLTVADVHTSQLDEIELCQRLSARTINPVLLLLPESSEIRVLEAYRSGADECIVKPISPALFLAKVTAWLRRSWTVSTNALDALRAGSFQLDPSRRQVVTSTGDVINLTNLEFRLLHLLICHCDQVLEANTIVDRVWGYAGGGDSALLKSLVYRLRRKIEPDPSQPQYIQTIGGVGYTFQIK